MDGTTLDIIHRVHELFKARGLTLSVAESCTGGLISHYVTHLPGASAFFKAGVISYSAEMKIKILGVSSDIISSSGVVSEQTAREMAEKLRLLTGTDISVSTTGNLGPDVLEGKETGLIYVAVSKEGRTFAKELRLRGNREENKEEAALEALRFLIEIAEKL
ncbi:MAG: CinA family protein [Thermodesulfovibrionales bacterium]|jgi:PncC family amidohydrolase